MPVDVPGVGVILVAGTRRMVLGDEKVLSDRPGSSRGGNCGVWSGRPGAVLGWPVATVWQSCSLGYV